VNRVAWNRSLHGPIFEQNTDTTVNQRWLPQYPDTRKQLPGVGGLQSNFAIGETLTFHWKEAGPARSFRASLAGAFECHSESGRLARSEGCLVRRRAEKRSHPIASYDLRKNENPERRRDGMRVSLVLALTHLIGKAKCGIVDERLSRTNKTTTSSVHVLMMPENENEFVGVWRWRGSTPGLSDPFTIR